MWAWDDHTVKKRKIIIKIGNETRLLSLENVSKIQEIKDFCIFVNLTNSTRVLVIKNKNYIINSNIEKPGFHSFIEENSVKEGINSDLSEFSLPHNSRILSETLNLSVKTTKTEVKIVVFIKGLGLSIFDTKNTENFYVSLTELKTDFSMCFINFGRYKKVQSNVLIGLKHFQIDSMDPDPHLFAIILSPVYSSDKKDNLLEQKEKNPVIEDNKDEENDKNSENLNTTDFFMFELSSTVFSKKEKDGVYYKTATNVEKLEVLLQKMQISLNEETLFKIINMKNYSKVFKTDSPKHQPSKTLNFSHDLPALPINPSTVGNKALIEFIKIGVLSISVTFKKGSDSTISKEAMNLKFLVDLLKGFGGAFTSISNAPFNFSELVMQNSFQTTDSLVKWLGKNYIRQGIIQVYKVFGSIDILGNPLDFLKNLGTGVFEFITEPAKGLIKSPKSFVKGLNKGLKSLMSGVVGGTFDSISKISGSLYTAVKNTTGDTIKDSRVSENIGKDFLLGLKDTAIDVYEGITGIVVKPFKGGKNDGAKGFFLGVYQGTAGLVTSPIKLVLKLSNAISTSIASTTFLITKGKIKTYGRQRFPRHVGANKKIEPYNKEFSQAKAYLDFLGKYKKERLLYFSEVSLGQCQAIKTDTNIILLLTSVSFLYILDGELYKKVTISDIKFLELHQFEKIYLLCLATESQNFSIPSRSYSSLACVYNVLASLNTNILQDNRHKFKYPKMFNREQLSNKD